MSLNIWFLTSFLCYENNSRNQIDHKWTKKWRIYTAELYICKLDGEATLPQICFFIIIILFDNQTSIGMVGCRCAYCIYLIPRSTSTPPTRACRVHLFWTRTRMLITLLILWWNIFCVSSSVLVTIVLDNLLRQFRW